MLGRKLLIGVGMAALVAAAFAGPAFALGPRVPDPIPATIDRGSVTVHLQTVASGLLNP